MDFSKFEPLGNRAVVRLETHEEHVTESGIIMQERNEDPLTRKARIGYVLATGPECEEVKVNDKIALSRYGGQAVQIDGNEYILIIEDEILGIF